MWALLLPVKFHGRVSGIWRYWFSQLMFADVGLHVSFTAPIDTQYLNPFLDRLHEVRGPTVHEGNKSGSMASGMVAQRQWRDLWEIGSSFREIIPGSMFHRHHRRSRFDIIKGFVGRSPVSRVQLTATWIIRCRNFVLCGARRFLHPN